MGKKNRGGSKTASGGVFKVAGAKSLKKAKSKAVQLGLKNIKKKVDDVDAQFLALSKQPVQKKSLSASAPDSKPSSAARTPVASAESKEATRQQIADTAEELVKMDV